MNLRRRLNDERGVVMPLVAAATAALLAMTSLTVDVGRVANRNRDLQAVADVVAVEAAGALGGVGIEELDGPAFVTAVQDAAARNGFAETPVVTAGQADSQGHFTEGATPTTAWRFVAAGGDQLVVAVGVEDVGTVSPGEALDVVGVWARDRVDFAFGVGTVNASRAATAQTELAAGVGIGTRLLALGDATGDPTILNLLLGRLLGIDADLVSYEGLAGAGVTLSELAVNLDAGTVEQLLGLEVGVADFLLAAADALEQDGDLVRAELLETLVIPIGPALKVPIGELVTVGLGGAAAAASAELDVLGLVTAVAMIAGGDNAVSLDGEVLLPGLLSVPVMLTVIEPPQVAFGPEGTTARTAQIRVELAPEVSLDLNLGLVRLTTTAAVPVSVAVAGGVATISDIHCDPDPAGRSVQIDAATTGAAVTGGANLAVDLDLNLGLFQVPVVGVGVEVGLASNVAASDPGPVTFTAAGPNPYGKTVTVGGGEVNLVDVATTVTVDEAKLLVLNLGPLLGGVTGLVTTIVNGVTNGVLLPVNALVGGLLTVLDGVLGLGLAEADVTATAPTCGAARLIA